MLNVFFCRVSVSLHTYIYFCQYTGTSKISLLLPLRTTLLLLLLFVLLLSSLCVFSLPSFYILFLRCCCCCHWFDPFMKIKNRFNIPMHKFNGQCIVVYVHLWRIIVVVLLANDYMQYVRIYTRDHRVCVCVCLRLYVCKNIYIYI